MIDIENNGEKSMNIFMTLTNPFTHDLRVYNEANSLVKANHNITVLDSDRKKENSSKDVKDGINIIRSNHTKLMDKMNKKTKICFVGSLSSSFISKDCEILKKHFDVDIIQPPKIKSGLFKWMKYIFKLLKKVKQSDVTFSWFAGWHSAFAIFFSKLFRKKSIVIVGGYDAAFVPEINYGAFTNLKEKLPIMYLYKKVDKILVVDLSLKNDIIKNAKIKGDNINYVPTGYNPKYWMQNGEKENIVLTVGGVSKSVVKRKGFVTFVKAAKYLPNIKFVLVGKFVDNSIKDLRKIATDNVEFTGFVTDEELIKWYQKAKVYCQLSRYEGLPNALCESMLCECIPVGTRHCGIPTGIGNTGYYVPFNDEKKTAEAINNAISHPSNLRKKARERIIKQFPIKKRENELYEIIADLVK